MIDKNLYFSTSDPITIQAPHPVVTPLGEIIYAGTKWNSQATYGHAPPPDYLRPTPHYLLVYTLEGEADYFDSTGVKTILKKGSLVWARPGIDQSYGPCPGSRWSEFFIWFSGPIFDCWNDQGLPGKQTMILKLEPVKYWLNCFRAIVEPNDKEKEQSPLNRLCNLQTILSDAIRQQQTQPVMREDAAWLESVCIQLRQGTLTRPSLPEIARSMNMSYSLFRSKFTTLAGISPGRFRTEDIMSRACRLLLETTHSIAEIAMELEFNDQFHFSRRFKQFAGMSPRNFRYQAR